MASSVPVRSFLQQRRDRAVGSILGHVEGAGLKTRFTEAEWQSFRRIVIDASNSYHDSVLDLVKAEEGVVRNDHLVEVLQKVERVADQVLAAQPIQTPVHSDR